MKKLCTVCFMGFIAAVVIAAIYFSPLGGIGEAYSYRDNLAVERIDGLCYTEKSIRADVTGGAEAAERVLKHMLAKLVKTEQIDEITTIYAYSPRVCAKSQYTAEGLAYNVMIAVSGDNVSIGTPLLFGSY